MAVNRVNCVNSFGWKCPILNVVRSIAAYELPYVIPMVSDSVNALFFPGEASLQYMYVYGIASKLSETDRCNQFVSCIMHL